MSFDIHTRRFLSKPQLVLLNKVAWEHVSPTAQPPDVVEGLDEGMYVVTEAKVDTESELVRALVLVNIGMIPALWVEMSVADYRLLPSVELPGEDSDFNRLPLAIQDREE
jgi:hypothetical protein